MKERDIVKYTAHISSIGEKLAKSLKLSLYTIYLIILDLFTKEDK